MKALVTAKIPEQYVKRLEAIANDITYTGRGYTGIKLTAAEMAEAIGDSDLVIGGIEEVGKLAMDSCPNLKIIACCRNEAFASVDIEEATKRGLPVLATVGRNAVSVAEYVFGLLLACCKNISTLDYLLRHTDQLAGKQYKDKQEDGAAKKPQIWSTDPSSPAALYGNFPELCGKKFGQIGYGTIGREVAKRALAFEMEVLISDPFASEEAIAGKNARLVDLPALMEESDFISINCNVTPATVGLVNREMLSRMKPTAYIINTARAPILDYDALYDLLKEKKIAGAGLDVYPVEPVPKGDKLLSLDNVVLTPHMAGQSRDIPHHQASIILENIEMLLRGETPKTICNAEVLPAWFEKNREIIKK